MREQFRVELKEGVNQIINRLNKRYLKLADARKDEFESEPEFQQRLKKERAALDREQTGEFTALQDRLEKEYNLQLVPFNKELKKLSRQEFTITAENLILELGAYKGETNTYPVKIKARKPLGMLAANLGQPDKKKYILLAANADIPIPRDEAREFKQHFQNDMLRPEIKGNFYTPEVFMIAQAYVIDDATTRQYDLFASRLVDLGNGTIFDTSTKLIWSKKGSNEGTYWSEAISWINRLNGEAYLGFRDWRMPTLPELRSLAMHAIRAGYVSKNHSIADFLNRGGFEGLQKDHYWTANRHEEYTLWYGIDFDNGEEKTNYNDYRWFVLPVRSSSELKPAPMAK